MVLGLVSSAALCASGVAGVGWPGAVTDALELPASSARGRAEARAGLGGTFAALGAWALARRSAEASTAIGVVWLGAGIVRLASLRVDRPRTDAAFGGYLTVELLLGSLALADARSRA